MPQTLRTNFSLRNHQTKLPSIYHGLQASLSLNDLLSELRHYLKLAQADLLQPRQQVIDRILREALY